MDPRMEIELHRANERFIDMLVDMAHRDAAPMFDLVKQFQRQLTKLDVSTKRRASARPYFLMDFRFQDATWWQSLKTMPPKHRHDNWPSHYARKSAVEFARRALTLAWHAAEGPTAARPSCLLGICPRVADAIASHPLEDLDRIADRYVSLMRPRWDDRPSLWRRLLNAAQTGDISVLQSIDLHGAQLLASDLLNSAEA